jgi:glycosyltransferase involved in cell wall biosynthesis
MIEAMACGTPVVAYHRVSVPEVVDEGISGFVLDGSRRSAAVERARRVDRIGVCHCSRFSVERMTETTSRSTAR